MMTHCRLPDLCVWRHKPVRNSMCESSEMYIECYTYTGEGQSIAVLFIILMYLMEYALDNNEKNKTVQLVLAVMKIVFPGIWYSLWRIPIFVKLRQPLFTETSSRCPWWIISLKEKCNCDNFIIVSTKIWQCMQQKRNFWCIQQPNFYKHHSSWLLVNFQELCWVFSTMLVMYWIVPIKLVKLNICYLFGVKPT